MNWQDWIDLNLLKQKFADEWFADLIFKKWEEPQFSTMFMWSTYSVTMWSTDEMELSLHPRAHFVDLIVDLIFKKCPKKSHQFFYDSYVKSSSHYSLVHICRPYLQKVEKHQFFFTILFETSSHLQKVVRTRQFSTMFIWNRALASPLKLQGPGRETFS